MSNDEVMLHIRPLITENADTDQLFGDILFLLGKNEIRISAVLMTKHLRGYQKLKSQNFLSPFCVCTT